MKLLEVTRKRFCASVLCAFALAAQAVWSLTSLLFQLGFCCGPQKVTMGPRVASRVCDSNVRADMERHSARGFVV